MSVLTGAIGGAEAAVFPRAGTRGLSRSESRPGGRPVLAKAPLVGTEIAMATVGNRVPQQCVPAAAPEEAAAVASCR